MGVTGEATVDRRLHSSATLVLSMRAEVAMADATILIPTHRHASLLPYAVRSALAQEAASVDVFVVGDGVEDDTRSALAPFLSDPRVRFFDFPKAPGRGEGNRHAALQEASAPLVCYLSDDDLLLAEHVAEMAQLLDGADFAHSAPVIVDRDGSLAYLPIDLAQPAFRSLLLRGGWNAISLSGAAHTLDAYRRLTHGWRPAPPGVWSDLYMWQQFAALPGFRGRTATRLTHLHLADADRRDIAKDQRVAELERWWMRAQSPGFAAELACEVANAVRDRVIEREVAVHTLEGVLARVQATRLWRMRTWVASLLPVRRLLAYRRGK